MNRLSYRIIGNALTATKGGIARSEEKNFDLRTRDIFSATGDLRGVVVTCHSGLVWVTQKGDFRDHMLVAGEQTTIGKKGKVLIQALADASFSVVAPGMRRQAWSRLISCLHHFGLSRRIEARTI